MVKIAFNILAPTIAQMRYRLVFVICMLALYGCAAKESAETDPVAVTDFWIEGFDEQGQMMQFDGDYSRNYFNDVLIRILVGADDYVSNGSIKVTASVDNAEVFTETRNGVSGSPGGQYAFFIIPGNLVTCKTFVVKVDALARTKPVSKSKAHNADCGE